MAQLRWLGDVIQDLLWDLLEPGPRMRYPLKHSKDSIGVHTAFLLQMVQASAPLPEATPSPNAQGDAGVQLGPTAPCAQSYDGSKVVVREIVKNLLIKMAATQEREDQTNFRRMLLVGRGHAGTGMQGEGVGVFTGCGFIAGWNAENGEW